MKRLLPAILVLLVAFSMRGETLGWNGDRGRLADLAPSAYGSTGLTAVTIPGPLFVTQSNATEWSIDGSGYIYAVVPALTPLLSGVSLPSGARIERLELVGCDTSATGEMFFYLYVPLNDGTYLSTEPFHTGIDTAGGCGVYGGTLASPFVVQSAFQTIDPVVFSTGGGGTRFRSFRLFYRRQVSEAPQTATFADVPTTHPFFRFVEALSAAGITGGCGGGNYCPNNPVTRGQMAVFLASALGLHWAD